MPSTTDAAAAPSGNPARAQSAAVPAHADAMSAPGPAVAPGPGRSPSGSVTDTPAQAHALAHAVGAAMFAADHASREFMQMELLECEPGRARMRMAVRDELLNGHQICHGGFIFTLADSTFAFACNSHNKAAVAAGCSIEFLRPARSGDVLTCSGQEQTLQGRHGIYDMRVENQRGEVIALFRGKSAQITGTVLPATDSKLSL